MLYRRTLSSADRSLAALHALVERSSAPAWVMSADRRLAAANAAFARCLDSTIADLVGRRDDELFQRTLAEDCRAADRLALDTNTPVVRVGCPPRGRWHLITKIAIGPPGCGPRATVSFAVPLADGLSALALIQVSALNSHGALAHDEAALETDESSGATPEWLKAVRRRVEAHERVSLRSIAREVGMHPDHLNRLFKRHYGKPISRVRREARLTRVTERLMHTRASIADIAAELGFADHSHLTRTFRAIMGVSPKRFRALHDRGSAAATESEAHAAVPTQERFALAD